MSEHDPKAAWLAALLAQEKGVSAERYADYRQQLDEQIAAQAHRGKRAVLRSWRMWAGVGVAASVLVALIVWQPWRSTGSGPEALVVLRPAENGARFPEPPAPFFFERTADVIAVCSVGETLEHHKESVVRLQVERTLKGEWAAPMVAARDHVPRGFCCVSSVPGSKVGAPGSKALIYLTRSGPDWNLVHLEPLDKEAPQLADKERFLEVALACQSEDAKHEVARCLAGREGGLDRPARYALEYHADADVLLDQLKRVRGSLLHVGACTVEGRARPEVQTFAALVELLSRRCENRAVAPVGDCVRHFPAGSRADIYRALPELCRFADEPTQKSARKLLIDEIRSPEGEPSDVVEAIKALGQLADLQALDVLIQEQARQPVAATHLAVLQSLRSAYDRLGAAEQGRIAESWLSVLGEYPPHPTPEPTREESDFILGVIAALKKHSLNAEQRLHLQTIQKERGAEWFSKELRSLKTTPIVK